MNGWRGQSRKKIGNDVTYVMKGQQIARSKAANVANPRTAPQMTQRIRLANLVGMYRANKGWMEKYAFEKKKQKWSTYNAFVSANISGSQVALTKSEAAAGAVVVAPYKMTDGTLPQIQIVLDRDENQYATDLYIGTLEIDSTTTIGELSAALIANNNGIVNGMQLSLIENEQEVVNNIPRVVVRAYEFIINEADTTLLLEKWGSSGITTYGGATQNSIGYSMTDGASAFTFCLSHTYGGKTHVGTSYMVLVDPAVYDSYTSSTAIDLAIQSYGSGNSTPFLDSTEAAGVSEGGANPDVPQETSILSVAIQGAGEQNPTAVVPGRYLGGFGGETNVALLINVSNSFTTEDLRGITVTVKNGGSTSTVSNATLAANGRQITATFASVDVNPNYPIVRVDINTNSGPFGAEFSDEDGGVEE